MCAIMDYIENIRDLFMVCNENDTNDLIQETTITIFDEKGSLISKSTVTKVYDIAILVHIDQNLEYKCENQLLTRCPWTESKPKSKKPQTYNFIRID